MGHHGTGFRRPICEQNDPTSIATVIDRIREAPHLSRRRRADLASALRTLCRALGSDPTLIVADIRSLSKRLATVSPAVINVGAERWANMRSLGLAAFREVGIRALRGRYRDRCRRGGKRCGQNCPTAILSTACRG